MTSENRTSDTDHPETAAASSSMNDDNNNNNNNNTTDASDVDADEVIMQEETQNSNNNNNKISNIPLHQHPLDETWYYYQNPTTGTVSSTPLTVRQLCKLLCPVREGMAPILPPHTQCLKVQVETSLQQEEEKEMEESSKQQTQPQQQQQQPQSSVWKMASEWPVLKEASAQWHVSVNGGASKGPMSCRGVLTLEEEEEAKQSSTIMVYAENVTSEWTLLSKLDQVQWVLQALMTQTQTTTTPAAKNGSETKKKTASATSGDDKDTANTKDKTQEVQDELEAFLSSTAAEGDTDKGGGDNDNQNDDDDDDHMYESDGGTKYVKDPITGNWIHEALAPQASTSSNTAAANTASNNINKDSSSNPNKKNKKKSKKAQFAKRNAKHWIYVTGLPTNSGSVTVDDLAKYFGKAGLLDLDPESLQPKIKLYKDALTGQLKGDASLCYARPESVALAIQILDESPWDEKHMIRVEKATFQAKEGEEGNNDNNNDNNNKRKKKKAPISEAKRKVARLALRQAQDEGFGERLAGGLKGLRIIVVKNMLEGIPEAEVEQFLVKKCEAFGDVEKITVVESTKTCLLKFVEPSAASDAIRAWHHKEVNKSTRKKIHAIYWDGVTDYTHVEEDEEKKRQEEEQRHDEFGKWLETQNEEELPPELRLRVEPE